MVKVSVSPAVKLVMIDTLPADIFALLASVITTSVSLIAAPAPPSVYELENPVGSAATVTLSTKNDSLAKVSV